MRFRAAATGFTLLLVLLVVLFFRSIYTADLIRYRMGSGTYLEVATVPSQLRISRGVSWPIAQPLEWTHGPYRSMSNSGAVGHHLMRWQAAMSVDNQLYHVSNAFGGVNRVSVSTIALPFQTLILLATLPLLLLWGSRKLHRKQIESRRKAGLCVRCGYDVRASNHRCPECGTIFQTLASAWSNNFRRLAWRCQ
jgi:hypothetical protein